ncbi:MAG: type II secretion system protein GspC [Halothiobacillus sp.]|nr:type II secretion system protein GspC [Halothiobacillus sp.]
MSWSKRRFVWIPSALFLILLATAGVLAARITWLWLAPAPVYVPPAGSGAQASEKSQSASVEQIGGWHLFGQAATPNRPEATKISASQLGVKLEGIISGSPSPLVMLRVGGEVRLLQVGDALSAGVSIVSIAPDRVVISNQGRLESIAFPKPQSLDQAPAPSAASLTTANPRDVSAAAVAPTVRALAEKIRHNPQTLLRFVTVSPVQQDGEISGYSLRPVPGQEALMRALGLMPGDVLTSVDGMPVNDPALLPRVMPLLNSGQPLQVQVERGGQPLSMTINLDSLQ